MLYYIAKIIMTPALRLFYRRVYVTGLEVIPPKGPAIILANHPSAVMDAAIMGVLVKRPVWFFTRGDVFINKRVNWLLATLRMIPVHNHESGRDTLRSNDDSFIKAEKILSAGGILLFFPEGNSRIKRNLSPLRKGVFRMAFQAAQKNNFRYDIPFIPAGINYDHPTVNDADVMVHFGKPFFLSDYRKTYEDNANSALLQMTKDGFAAMEKNVLHIADAANYTLVEKCLTIQRSNYSFFTGGWQQATRKKFMLEKHLCNTVNTLEKDKREVLQTKADSYFYELKKYGLADETISPSFSFSLFTKWLFFLTAPLFLLSYILNAMPLLTGKRIADKRANRIDYYSWIWVSSSAILYVAWLIILFVGFLVIGWQYALGIVTLTMVSGIFLYHYKKWWRAYIQFLRLKALPPDKIIDLQSLRQAICNYLC